MQLFLNATSPFARVARVAALHHQLQTQLQLVWCDPWNNDPALLAVHPQARIPVLVTETGDAISESLLIAQYLDHIGHGSPLLPTAQLAALLARTSEAYGLMEAAFNVVIARKNDGAATADASMMGQRRLAAIARVLQQWEAAPPPAPTGALTLAALTCAVALDYLRFRLPALFDAAHCPQLQQWHAQAHAAHPHLQATFFSA